MSYATDHADALADVTESGVACTFSKQRPGTLNPLTERYTSPTSTSVSGKAIEIEGDTKRYRELGVIEHNPATLFFVPTTYSDEPSLDMECSWGGFTRTVKDVRRLAPDGTAIAHTVVVAK